MILRNSTTGSPAASRMSASICSLARSSPTSRLTVGLVDIRTPSTGS